MDTVQIRVAATDDVQDILVAELASLPVQGFENEPGHLSIYVSEKDWLLSAREDVERVLARHRLKGVSELRRIKHQNWNEIWEQSIQPIVVERFLIRPSWHESPARDDGRIELVIDPKMSFGTGHHETTRLMLRHMLDQQHALGFVLDAGTGTGILAIAAARLGADRVIAYDIDPICLENARENVEVNQVDAMVSVRLGTLETVSEKGFSLIMANINRNVLLAELEGFASRLSSGGILLLAGLQLEDRERMLAALSDYDLRIVSEKAEGDWWSVAAAQDAA